MQLSQLKANLEDVRTRIAKACRRAGRSPDEVTLIAVSKTVETPALEAAHSLGINHFGENRVQEAENKVCTLASLKPPITWHMIGHLQSNKVKTALELFGVIHSVDSIDLAANISRRSVKTVKILLQVNVAQEITKTGFAVPELQSAFATISAMPNVEVLGLMTIAPLAQDANQVRPVFRKLRELRDSLGLKQLSMGMTDDFEVALEEGATMVRIGRAIFGERGDK